MSNKKTNDSQQDDDSNLRRRLLQGLGGVSAVGLAGCSDQSNDSTETTDEGGADTETQTPTETETETETGTGSSTQTETTTEQGGSGSGGEAATNWDNYTVTELDTHNNMMSMDVAPDGRVFYITRGAIFGEAEEGTAKVNYVNPDSGETGNALELPVGTFEEDGGQGITFHPNFEENNQVFIFYVPRDDVVGDDPYMLVSRFEMADNTIDPDTETEIIRIPHQRERCCHVGGYLDFDSQGNLYISLGDDTDPFESSGFAPIDGRDGRKYFDARRTAGNTADFRGGILRITPSDDGGYTIPEGNLFPEDEYSEEISSGTVKPEIYVLGMRNPYTFSIDEETDELFVADYGPDASEWNPDRGPVGIVELRRICEAHNAGWPFSRGYHYPYRRYDFETEESGQPYWPANLTNDSPHNDGLEKLPPVVAPDVWYPRSWDGYVQAPGWANMPKPGEQSWPSLPEGGAPEAGPRYRYSEDFGAGALDEHFDGKQFFMEWGNNYIKYITYNDDGSLEINDFLPNQEFQSPNDMAIGPNGRMFLQTYGPGFSGENGKIYMIEYEA